jgi:hypothetical protein
MRAPTRIWSRGFGLERIAVGGEIVSEGLKERAPQLLGSVEVNDDYGRRRWINKEPPQAGYGPTIGSLNL